MALRRDHIPIVIQLDLQPRTQNASSRFLIKEIKKSNIKAEIRGRLAQLSLFNRETATPQDVDQRLEEIQSVILEALQNNCPKARPSQYARPG